MSADNDTIVSYVGLKSIPANKVEAAPSGVINIANVAGALSKVDENGAVSGLGGGGAVTKIVGGTNVTLSPTSGIGDVTINASGGIQSVTATSGGGAVVDNTDPLNPKVGIAPYSSNIWFPRVAGFIASQVSTLVTPIMANDCDMLSNVLLWLPEALSNAGTNTTTTLVTTKPGGVIRCATGATNGSSGGWRNSFGTAAPVAINLRTSKYAQAVRVKIVATASLFDLELCGYTDAATANVWLGATQATSGTNWVIKSGTATAVDTGVAFTIGSYVTLVLIADGTNITGYVGAGDGTNIVKVGASQSQSTCPNAAGAVQEFVQNFTSGANVEAQWDKILCVNELPT